MSLKSVNSARVREGGRKTVSVGWETTAKRGRESNKVKAFWNDYKKEK